MVDVFHFDVAGARLFGAWHPPLRQRSRTGYAVICPPFGREAPPAHVLGRRVAEELAGIGVGTLRFDYFGTGDSEGASTDATLERWFVDIAGAVEEARQRSSGGRACIVGIRLGALLGAWHGARAGRGAVSALCALDPIPSGEAQIDETRRLEAAGWADLEIEPASSPTDDVSLMGIPWSEGLVQELGELDVRALPDRPGEHVGLFVGPEDHVGAGVWMTAHAGTGGVERIDVGMRITPSFSEGIWPPGRAPRAVAEWVERHVQ
jgi:pimeloyl-ACP methyl ester carboxylesterase